MLIPTKMEQINIVVFDKDIEAVTRLLIELGMVHLVNIEEVEPWANKLSLIPGQQLSASYQELIKRIRQLVQKLDLTPELTKDVFPETAVSLEEIRKNLDQLELQINPLLINIDNKQTELQAEEQILRQVNALGPLEISSLGQFRHTFIEMIIGQVASNNLAIIERYLNPIPHLLMPFQQEEEKIKLIVICLKKDKAVLDKAVKESALEPVAIPPEVAVIDKDVHQELAERIKHREVDIAASREKLAEIKSSHRPQLLLYLKVLTTRQLILNAKNFFRKTARTYLITGWIPQDKRRRLTEAIQKVTAGCCYCEQLDPLQLAAVQDGRVEVPVQLNNPSFLKPFELLTVIFGLPRYNTIDPTVFVAITYFIMFGAMFGDVGHGLVLGLIGLLLLRQGRQGFIKAGGLLLYCGLAAAIFGILYGSYFGLEDVFPPLWLHPMRQVMDFLVISIVWGVAVISIGIVINVINAVRTHNTVKGIFDKAGILGGLVYWGAIGLLCRKLAARETELTAVLIIAVIGSPILLLFLKGPLLKLIHPKEKVFPQGFFNYLLDTIVELIEIFIGYLANTVSFIRIAAFALAHAGLFIAVFSLADILHNTKGGLVSASVVILLGNILIIGLEGLIVAVQGLRLEYYEFFSKFFIRGNREYKPIGLN